MLVALSQRARNVLALYWQYSVRKNTPLMRCFAQSNGVNTVIVGARNRNRTGTPAINEAADFKCKVPTANPHNY